MTLEEFQNLIPVNSNCDIFQLDNNGDSKLLMTVRYLGIVGSVLTFDKGYINISFPVERVKELFKSFFVENLWCILLNQE